MRILKVTQAYHPYLASGGPAVKVRALAERLAAQGHGVTVLTADLGPRAAGVGAAAVETVYLSTFARYRATTMNPGALAFCLRRMRDFDAVHIYGLYDLLGPLVAGFCRRFQIPYVVEPMGMYRPIVRSIRLKQTYHRLLGQTMIAGAERLIATSEQERNELVEGGVPAAKVMVRRNGVEIPDILPPSGAFRRHWGLPDDVPLVLFLGRLSPKKSPDMLIEAFHQVASSRVPGIRLVIAGPDEEGYQAQLEAQAAACGMGQQVIFTGPLYDDAKWAAYRDATAFVLPSQNENFGNTVAEAVACGTPVLVTDRCGIAPLVAGRAGLVVSYDVTALAAGLCRLLTELELQQQFRAAATALSRELAWEEPVAELASLYEHVVRKRL